MSGSAPGDSKDPQRPFDNTYLTRGVRLATSREGAFCEVRPAPKFLLLERRLVPSQPMALRVSRSGKQRVLSPRAGNYATRAMVGWKSQ